ncbi:retinoblastoma-associated protein isoform X1 [Conger conger]|uniref:retinoblastoma-associated protein isoform X1 n=2 Tax=Conger conger TaxID=82655 RepID=UPI002A5A449C|nr:retinoblastoma-associated protein isoform X1 [Conger conger]
MPPKTRSTVTPLNKEINQSNVVVSSVKEKISDLSIDRHKDKDVEFLTLSEKLKINDHVCDHAWSIWDSVRASKDIILDTNLKVWGACLFIAATDLEIMTFTFTEVQKAVDLNVKDFFNLLKKLDVNMDTISTKVNGAMARLEKKYEVSHALFQRFQKMCGKIYADASDSSRKDSPDGKRIICTCWTLFLLAKGRVLQVEDDLVISFQLLMCVLEFCIRHSPSSMLLQPYKKATNMGQPMTRTSRRNHSKAKPCSPEVNLHLLQTLCEENECSMDEVKDVCMTSFSAFLESMGLSGTEELPETFELSNQYEELYLKSKDFDARLFLDHDKTLQMSEIDLMQLERTPKKNPTEEELVIPPQTPVRVAMNSIQQLKVVLASASDEPSDVLSAYFKNCTVDPTQEIIQRVRHLGEHFGQRFAQAMGQRCMEIGSQRFTLGTRLYFRVMESMLKSEEKRLSVQNFSKLLNDSAFHTSLLACALEVVTATYGGTGGFGVRVTIETDLSFPWVLDVFQLVAYDFYKVIESFIKAESSLSRDMIKHLEHCEHLVLESIAWRGDSPLFELLCKAQEEGPGEQAEPPANLNQPLQHSHTAADLYLSPIRPSNRIPTRAEALDTPTLLYHPTQAPRHPRSTSLSLFYKKVHRLAYLRLNMMCSLLLTSHPELEPVMWTLFQHTLQHEYELMRDRHLDQLMMSAMYAICKVKNIDLRFKTIVTAYKNLPNTKQETFKRVLIREGQYDSIIVFYNLVFMQRLKTNILQYASPRPPTLSPIPHIPCSPYKYPNSPRRVPGSNNVYISPMKSSRMSPSVMTPRTRILVSIGESFGISSSDKFSKINQMVSSSDWNLKRGHDGGPAPKPLKRLRFDTDGQDEADGSKPSGKSTLIQKLAEMTSTRTRIQEQKLKEDADSLKREEP